MLQTIRIGGLLSATGARWRSLAGLGILLAAVLQAVETHGPFEPPQLELVGLTTVVIAIAWLSMIARTTLLGVSVLGGASVALMLALPGTGPVVGVIAAIVNAGLRLSARPGIIVSIALALAFITADGFGSSWSSPVGLGFTGLGLAFTYVATASATANPGRARACRDAACRTGADSRCAGRSGRAGGAGTHRARNS